MMNLVPLPLAARHVYLCVEGYAPNARLNDRFNRLGRLMASLGGLYVMEGPDGTPRPLSREELARGLFKPGADVLVTHECIEKAIDALRRSAPDALSLAAA
jgi:hypothetical protein